MRVTEGERFLGEGRANQMKKKIEWELLDVSSICEWIRWPGIWIRIDWIYSSFLKNDFALSNNVLKYVFLFWFFFSSSIFLRNIIFSPFEQFLRYLQQQIYIFLFFQSTLTHISCKVVKFSLLRIGFDSLARQTSQLLVIV